MLRHVNFARDLNCIKNANENNRCGACQSVKNHQIIIWDQTKLLLKYIIMLKSCFSHIIICISTTFLFVKLMKTPPGSIIKATHDRYIKYFIFNSEIVKCLSMNFNLLILIITIWWFWTLSASRLSTVSIFSPSITSIS